MIRPYLRDLIDEHKPITESNTTINNNTNDNNSNNNNNNNNNNINDNTNNNNTDNNNTNNSNSNSNNNSNNNRAEWKIQLIIKNNFVSVKNFEDTCTIYIQQVNQ